jgi:hypothetical protein
MQTNLCSLLVLLLLSAAATAFLLDAPASRWTHSLPAGLTRGNAIVSYSANHLLVTTKVGSLHVLDASTGSVVMTYDPTESTPLQSTSGVAVYDDDDDTSMAVYSVTDGTSSLVIAIRLTDGSVGWEVSVPGIAVGTPLVGTSAVYVVHNTVNGLGQISVIPFSSPQQVAASFPDDNDKKNEVGPFGPGVLQTIDGRDVVVVAESLNDGFSESGNLFMLVQEDSPAAALQYKLRLASAYPRSAVARPAMTENLEVFLGQQGSVMSAWVGKNDVSGVLSGAEDVTPRWEKYLEEDREDDNARKSKCRCTLYRILYSSWR